MNIDVKKSLTNRKLNYDKSFLGSINDLLPTVFLSIIFLFLLTQLVLNIREDFRTIGIIVVFILIVTTLLISSIKEYVNLDQLEEIKTKSDKGENKRLAIVIAAKLKWRLLDEKADYITVRNPSRLLNGGENITLLFTDNSIFFISASYPINDVTRTTLTFGVNRRNLTKFKKYLSDLKEE